MNEKDVNLLFHIDAGTGDFTSHAISVFLLLCGRPCVIGRALVLLCRYVPFVPIFYFCAFSTSRISF